MVKQGFTGPIYTTDATWDLCEILLRDAGHLNEEGARNANKYGYSKHTPALPLYTEQEAVTALKQFRLFEFHTPFAFGKEVKMIAKRAGHILGSSFLTFHTPKGKLVFSGDVGRPYNLMVKSPEPIKEGDFLILESTYGNRKHPKENPLEELKRVIIKTAKRGGTVLIPSFAVGRAQMLLYFLYQLKQKNEIPDLPVYLDSPMAQDATDLLKRHLSELQIDAGVCKEVCQSAHYPRTSEESKKLNDNKMPSIIISASGMAEGGRILHHLARLAPHPQNTILFSGFQAFMTRGDRILRGEPEVKIHGIMTPIRAEVKKLESLSSHADWEEMIVWLKNLKETPKKVFLTHGEHESSEAFKQKLIETFSWDVEIPEEGKKILF